MAGITVIEANVLITGGLSGPLGEMGKGPTQSPALALVHVDVQLDGVTPPTSPGRVQPPVRSVASLDTHSDMVFTTDDDDLHASHLYVRLSLEMYCVGSPLVYDTPSENALEDDDSDPKARFDGAGPEAPVIKFP